MFGCNATVTMWRKRFNKTTGKDEWTRKILPVKCKWRNRESRTVTESGEIVKQYVTVVVPCENGYKFNGKIGDYMALGAYKVDITGEKPHRADDMKKKLGNVFIQITGIKDISLSSAGKRYRVEGVF